MEGPTSFLQVMQPVVDVHAHIMPASYVDVLREVASVEGGVAAEAYRRLTEDIFKMYPSESATHMVGRLVDRVSILDLAGIDIQVISAGSSLAYAAKTRFQHVLIRAWNDAVHYEIQGIPERFRMFAALPFPDVDAVLKEIERVADRSSNVGFLMNSHIGGVALADPRWDQIHARWNDLEATVFCHPDGFRCGTFAPGYLKVDVGTQFENTLTAVQLIESGTVEKFPRITWIIPHLGGALPFVIGRIDEHWERDRELRSTSKPPSQYLEGRILFDTAGHDCFAVRVALERFGIDQFVFGTDFPMIKADRLGEVVSDFVQAAGATENAIRIASENAKALIDRR